MKKYVIDTQAKETKNPIGECKITSALSPVASEIMVGFK